MKTVKSKKRIFHLRLIPKALFILIIGFAIRTLFSCTREKFDPVEIEYNAINIIGIDNSGQYVLERDTVHSFYPEAVALKIRLTDSTEYFASSLYQNMQDLLSFQTLKADSPEITYIPENKVTDIHITTLYDINGSLQAGDDISDHILYYNGTGLYHGEDQAVLWLSGKQTYPDIGTLLLVLKASVNNTIAQFEITVTLEDGKEIKGITEIFTITASEI